MVDVLEAPFSLHDDWFVGRIKGNYWQLNWITLIILPKCNIPLKELQSWHSCGCFLTHKTRRNRHLDIVNPSTWQQHSPKAVVNPSAGQCGLPHCKNCSGTVWHEQRYRAWGFRFGQMVCARWHQQDVRIQGFPAEQCTAVRWTTLFASTISVQFIISC